MPISKKLKKKLADLPKTPGVYMHKDKKGQIIYVGKAAVLNNRVRQYFQPATAKSADDKTKVLIAEIVDTDWTEVDNELEALFLEAELIKRYKPQYNILERDDKASSYVRIDRKSKAPSVTTTRRPLDDGAEYFGPYINTFALRRALKYLRRVFPYSTHTTLPSRACLQVHIGLCPGPETLEFDLAKYQADLGRLISYLKGNRVALIKDLETGMKKASKDKDYEQAAILRNQLHSLRSLSTHIIFSDKESQDLSKDHALVDMYDLLGLRKLPRRIEGYDISHMSGTNTTASMVVFSNGVSDKSAYRKFKMRIPGNDDYAHMREVITRRFSQKNIKSWGMPDVVLIDGGKGQLSSAIFAASELGIDVHMIGLAKQSEQIVIHSPSNLVNLNETKLVELEGNKELSEDFVLLNIPESKHLIKLLQRIRDESHRFAVSYHSTLKVNAQKKSVLDDIPGVGPGTRKKLLRKFGSLSGIKNARKEELTKEVGEAKAKLLRRHLRKDSL